jgi:hypothetical protein
MNQKGAGTNVSAAVQGGIGNMSYEVMQSFMQRIVEGSEPGLASS